MNVHDISEITQKVRELRTLFAFGTRLIPFLEELFGFLEEIAPLMGEVHASIGDSKGKIPRVSSQIIDVTKATELASNEMLDHIEAALSGLSEIRETASESLGDLQALAGYDARLLAVLKDRLAGEQDDLLADIEHMMAERRSVLQSLEARSRAELTALDAISEKVTNIMASLQVQDITAQQLAAANFIIQSIYRRLDSLLARLNGAAATPSPEDDPGASQAFNEHARYDRSGGQQRLADGIIENLHAGGGGARDSVAIGRQRYGGSHPDASEPPFGPTRRQEPYSQDDIDRLFHRS